MPSLGSLWYGVMLKDMTDADLKKIEQKLQNIGIKLDTAKLTESLKKSVESYKGKDLSLGVKEQFLHDAIRAALKQPTFPIKVRVEAASAQQAVRDALQRAGLQRGFTAADKRQYDAETKRLAAMQIANAKAAAASALAQQRLASAHRKATRATNSHTSASISLGTAMRGNIRIAGELGPMLASVYSIVALKNFMKKVIEIGGELEKQKLAMQAILGDKGFADTITSRINTLAVKSPFGVMELNQYAKQLTAFQIPYNELYDTMKRMADVSAAVGVDMGRIILAYGQVRAAKFLKGTELRQFTEANIPLIDMLAQRFTKLKGEVVSAGDIMDMISKKEISFEDVKAVLWELTNDGGRFYNMQEVLSESVQAKWKNLADAIDLMFADIAESTAGPLKGLAELLTALTSRWKTISVIIASAAGAFGVAKVATLAWNAALSKTTLSAIKDAKSTKQIEAANLRVASTYRTLTAAEQGLIHTKGRLTAAQYVQLAAEGKLTKEQVLRLIALKKLDANTIGHLRSVLGITKAEVSAAQATKAWRVSIAQLGATMRSVGRSIAGFFLNPLTIAMAAIGTVTALLQKNSEEMQKAKEIGDNVATSASEGAKNLKSNIDGFGSGEGMTDVQLSQGIERMQQLIKDYSPTPIEDINNALVAQDGHVRTLIEQYETLKNRLEELEGAYKGIDRTFGGWMAEGALKATDGSNWFTRLFDDSLAENAKDYTNALGRVTNRIATYSREYTVNMKSAVNAALNADEGFRKATSGMASYDEKLKYLAENSKKYYNAATAFDLEMNKRGYGEHLDYFSNASKIKAAREELIRDTDKFIADYNSRLRQQGINPLLMTAQQKSEVAIVMKSMLSQLEDAGDDAKALIANKLEESWAMVGMIMEDKIGPSMQEKFRALVGASTDEGVKVAVRKLQYEGYMALSDAEKKLVIDLMNEAKTQTMTELRVLNGYMQKYLTAHPLEQIITLSVQEKHTPLATELVNKAGLAVISESDNKNIIDWTKNGKVADAIDAATSARKAAKNELDLAKKTGIGVKAAQDAYDAIMHTIDVLGWSDVTAEKGGKSPDKDALAESLKQRFKDIKDAYAMFKEWAKLEGKDAAFKRVGNSGLFATLAPDKVPQTVDEYLALIDELEKELKAAGVKGKSQRETLANDLIKERFGINKDTFKEQLQLALDKVSKEAERQLADWNLYDKIRKATGNQDLAMNIAFGMNADAVTDYPTMIKKQFNDFAKAANSALTFDTATPEALAAAPTEVQKAWEDATKKLQQYAQQQKDAIADIVSEYQSLQDKLAKIDADRDEKIRKVNKSDMSAPEKAQYIQRIKVEADWQKFTQGADYLRFFSGIYSLTMEQAQQIGDKIRLHLDKRLQAGKISAEDYYKEIERINQQLSKLRNVKSDAMTFMTGGVKGLQQKKLEKADSDVLDQMTKVQKAEEALEKAKASGDMQQIGAANAALVLAKQELATREKIRDAIVKDMQAWQNVLNVVNIAGNIAGGMSDAFNSIRDMADAFGVDTESGAWDDIAAVMDTLTSVTGGVQKVVQSAMSGDIGGILSGAVSTITTPFTIWSKLHDKKLQKMIDRSKQAAQIMQNQYDILEQRMASFLGNAANMKVEGYSGEGGAYGKQRELMKGQLAELEKQRQAEIDKKKTDKSVVEDYNKQIEEMKISIREFAEEAAKDLYEIDLKDWAKQLGDALFEAWKRGEDGAEAFKKKASEIVGTVLNNIFRLNVLEPMMEQLANDLFGEDGQGGIFGKDFELTSDEVLNYVVDNLMKIGDAAEQYGEFMDEANRRYEEKTGQSLKDDESKSGLSAGIQSITEDTADLLASYINSIRSSVAMNETRWERLLNDAMPQMNVIAQSQLDTQRQIAENTLRTAQATEWLVKLNTSMESSWRRIAMREWGYQ